MSLVQEYRETLDYVRVLSYALLEVFKRRSELDDSSRIAWGRSVKRYRRSVEALWIILLPSLRPAGVEDVLREARRSSPEPRAVELLDRAVERIVEELDRKAILIPKRFLELGSFEGGEDADTLEEDS